MHSTMYSTVAEGWSIALPKDIASFGVLMMLGEVAVLLNLNFQEVFSWVEIWGLWRPYHIFYIIFLLLYPFTDPSCPMDGAIIIQEEAIPIILEETTPIISRYDPT